MQARVPELSLADYLYGSPSARAAFSMALMLGLRRCGFIILRDHSIAAASIDAAYALTAQFFAQTEAVKRRYVAGPRGYAPFRTEHAKNQTVPDLKEFWQIGPEHSDDGAGRCGAAPANIWPQSPAVFKQTFLALFAALQETGRVILEALAPFLGQPKDFFEALLRGRNSVLRLLHYPPVAGDEEAGGVRSAAHEDINLILDSGDMLARMTNDVIPATTHRVVNPLAANVSRYSMPFFMHPDADVVLRCLPSSIGAGAKYADIRAGTFLEQRLAEIGLVKAPDRSAGAGR